MELILNKFHTVGELMSGLSKLPPNTELNPFGSTECQLMYDPHSDVAFIDETFDWVDDYDDDERMTLSYYQSKVSIPTLYDNIAMAMYGRKGTNYDCSKVLVGESIFDACKEYVVESGGQESDFNMLWCIYGPKATLSGFDFEVEEGWCDFPKIATYQFTFADELGNPDSVQFCAYDEDEANTLFKEWCKNEIMVEPFDVVCEKVFNQADYDYYGFEYDDIREGGCVS